MRPRPATLRDALKKAHRTIKKLKAAVRGKAHQEPIAIIGMSSRYPGHVTDPESFWQLLDQGVDATTDMPAERWDVDAIYDPDSNRPGKMVTRRGGFVSGIDLFDPSFFGISDRAARRMDPQQRLLLEAAWQALEHAAIPPHSLKGRAGGVFIGLMNHDYEVLTLRGMESLDGYFGTGIASGMAAGRIAYVLGLTGPALTVDTACSSSLVAIHLACQALRHGECELALAGGATVMLTPALFVEFSRLRGLARDGRCKSFSANADGTAWSEGCGMIVLKCLSQAQQDGDPILALIRGSAVNQDGRSQGLTVPNGQAQQEVVRLALAQANVPATSIDYVECHGTGTLIGDPIEVQALADVLGVGRSQDRPLLLGSVKSNFGHTQAAAGVASVTKAVLALQHGTLPASLHCQTPNPRIPWSEIPLRVVTERMQWFRDASRPRFAGASSFGLSGTNAHVVLEEARPVPESSVEAEPCANLLLLSAQTERALNAQIECYRKHLVEHPEQAMADVCFTAAVGRTHFRHRLAVPATHRLAALALLDAVADGVTPPGVARGSSASRPKVIYWFASQGSPYRPLRVEETVSLPVFLAALERCTGLFTLPSGRVHTTSFTEGMVPSALFALEYALAAQWHAWGVEPVALVGHGVGEIAAACVAEVFSLEDAVRLVEALGGCRTGALAVDEFARVAGGVQYHEPRLRLVAGVTGAELNHDVVDPDYWVHSVFNMGAGDEGERVWAGKDSVCLELGVQCPATLTHSQEGRCLKLPSLLGEEDLAYTMLSSLGKLYVRGADLNWGSLHAHRTCHKVTLPTYPFQRQRHWVEAAVDTQST